MLHSVDSLLENLEKEPLKQQRDAGAKRRSVLKEQRDESSSGGLSSDDSYSILELDHVGIADPNEEEDSKPTTDSQTQGLVQKTLVFTTRTVDEMVRRYGSFVIPKEDESTDESDDAELNADRDFEGIELVVGGKHATANNSERDNQKDGIRVDAKNRGDTQRVVSNNKMKAKAPKKTGAELMVEGRAKLQSWDCFGCYFVEKHKSAALLFVKAGLQFRMQLQWEKAAQCYKEAMNCYTAIGSEVATQQCVRHLGECQHQIMLKMRGIKQRIDQAVVKHASLSGTHSVEIEDIASGKLHTLTVSTWTASVGGVEEGDDSSSSSCGLALVHAVDESVSSGDVDVGHAMDGQMADSNGEEELGRVSVVSVNGESVDGTRARSSTVGSLP